MNRPKRPPTIQIILRIIYVIALIYYLCNGNVFFDYVIIVTGIGAFFSPILYFLLVGVAVFTNYNK
ncbi:TPA: hypothetical protein TY903_000853 [Streptococcus suis]|nr:hypothetical protein [Streptococcus suis]